MFLDRLSVAARAAIVDASTRVDLAVRTELYEPDQTIRHVYFPIDAIVSYICIMNDGSQMDVGIVGREGIVGAVPALIGTTSPTYFQVQVGGMALKATRSAFTQVVKQRLIMSSLLRYEEAHVNSMTQFVACNRFHRLVKRLARWLLMMHDRVGGDAIPVTHETLSLMLGVRRTGVTDAALALQQKGLISYRRGEVTIRDRANLECEACECYDFVENRFLELSGYSIRKTAKVR